MAYIKDDNFYSIFGWMINELNLKGLELNIYAIIYGFSQDGKSSFHGSLQYLAEFTNSTRRGVIKALQSLLEKGYITKKEVLSNGIKFCVYCVTKFIGSEQSSQGGELSSSGVVNTVHWGSEQSSHNNINNNINNNIINNINNNKEGASSKKFVKPTVEEIKNYINEKGYKIDPESFYDFYESKGWKIGKSSMKDWRACVRTWSHRDSSVASCRRGTVWEDESRKASDNLQTILNLDNNF